MHAIDLMKDEWCYLELKKFFATYAFAFHKFGLFVSGTMSDKFSAMCYYAYVYIYLCLYVCI